MALSNHSPLPKFNEPLTLDQAYSLQHNVVSIYSPRGTVGIKAGLTATAAQDFFGLKHALLGSLYNEAVDASGSSVLHVDGRILECEVAIRIDKNGRPVSCAPAIEAVFLNFSHNDDMTASNLVASNLGAEFIVLGEFLPWADNFDAITVSASRNEETVHTADVTNALGGPSASAKWMLEEAITRGFNIGDGTLLMTGSCGSAIPADVGDYQVDFGPLGIVQLTIHQ